MQFLFFYFFASRTIQNRRLFLTFQINFGLIAFITGPFGTIIELYIILTLGEYIWTRYLLLYTGQAR